jgi:predicted nucleic acid-binding protein
MPFQPLHQIAPGTNVFIDANIFVYGLSETSAQCRNFLERCSREEIFGVSLFEIVNESTHKFMLAEAFQKGLISKETSRNLRDRFTVIPKLEDYWSDTQRILDLNLLLVSTREGILRQAHSERQEAALLTNDSMIISCMRDMGIIALATNDTDFVRVRDIEIFRPDDV